MRGADADTIAAIAGVIAEAFYHSGVTIALKQQAMNKLYGVE